MGRLVFIVEGDCELRFVERKIIPYLYAVVQEGHEVHICAQKITTNRRLNRSGGNVGFAYLKNEVGRVAKQGEPWVTTFRDFFRLPPDYPGYSLDSSKIDQVEVGVKAEVKYERFIPYIQRHEFEALLFAATDGFDSFLPKSEKMDIESISSRYTNVEDINGGVDSAPSKRLENIFNYDKVIHSELVWRDVPLEKIMDRAPRFKRWIDELVALVSSL